MAWLRVYTFSTALVWTLLALLVSAGCSPTATQSAVTAPAHAQSASIPAQVPSKPRRSTGSGVPRVAAATPIPALLAGDIGQQVPTSFIAASPTGHWTVLCEASEDTDNSGNLLVQVSQHGELIGDQLHQVLYLGGSAQPLDEYAGSDPTGRFLAFVKDDRLQLLNTSSNTQVTLAQADIRATQASFQSLRSVSFSDDGQWIAYATGEKDIVLRNLITEKETTYTFDEPKLYRLRFAPGGRFLLLEVTVTDTNRNGRLQWLTPERTDPATCPSPIPTFNVWQFPGDTPETRLLDVKTGNLIAPQGFAVAAGSVYIERTEEQSLLANEPGKPVRRISTKDCMARVMHIDLVSGNIVFGCASAWGQRRQIYLRTPDARVALNLDLAAYELDTRLPTTEPNITLYPGNQTLVFNVRTRERWPLLDGTQVLTIAGTTALTEVNQQLSLVKLNPDGSYTQKTTPIARPPFSGVLVQGSWVSVGNQVFNMAQVEHHGVFPSTSSPVALSEAGQGLYPTRPASPSTLGTGPLRWVTATR